MNEQSRHSGAAGLRILSLYDDHVTQLKIGRACGLYLCGCAPSDYFFAMALFVTS